MNAKEYQQQFRHYTKGLTHLSTGCCPGCDECGETTEDEGSFSWYSCDACGSALGGTRYYAHGRMLLNGQDLIVHLDVCEDCLN